MVTHILSFAIGALSAALLMYIVVSRAVFKGMMDAFEDTLRKMEKHKNESEGKNDE